MAKIKVDKEKGKLLKALLSEYGDFRIDDWCLYVKDNSCLQSEYIQKLVSDHKFLVQPNLF